VDGSTIPTSMTNAAVFSWYGGVGVDHYQLSVTDLTSNTVLYSANFPGTIHSATVTNLPHDGRALAVKLISVMSVVGQLIGDGGSGEPGETITCGSGDPGGIGGQTVPSQATTPGNAQGIAQVLNSWTPAI